MNYDTYYISNMMSILQEVLTMNEFITLAYELHLLGYTETLNKSYLELLNKSINDNSILHYTKGKDKQIMKKMINILHDTDMLEDMKIQYKQNYMSQHIFGRNSSQDSIETILNLIDWKAI